jgi:hypothetical protein
MGNGSSIFLSAELSKNLSEKSIRTFQDFENECIARNLNGEQIYDLLVSKYEELLDFNSHVPDPTQKPAEEKDEGESSMRKFRKVVRKAANQASWGASLSAKNKHAKRSEIYARYSKLNRRKTLQAIPLSGTGKAESTRFLPLKDTVDETNRNESLNEGIQLERTNSIDSLDAADEETVCIGFNEIQAQAGGAPEDFECKLCQKHFNSRARLDRHLKYSEVHRYTLIALKEKFFEDADGLENLAKKAINHFQDSAAATHSYLDGQLNIQRLRWKKAIGKVVSRFIARKYENIVNQLQSSFNGMNTSTTQKKVSLIHTDCKFFWRIKSRFIFHFYYHESFDCIEIIPQLLPTILLNSEKNSNNNDDGNQSIYSRGEQIPTTDVLQIQKAFLTDAEDRHHFETIPDSPRFYIDCRTIQRILLQHEIRIPEESGDENVNNNNSSVSAGVISSKYLIGSTKSTYTSSVTDLEMCKFLMSKFKVDYNLIEDGITVEKAVYFEDQHVLKNNEIIPINTVIPTGLKPVNLETVKLYEQWEIKTKLNEITQSHQLLNEAVNKAEEKAKGILLLSPNFIHRLSPLLSPTKKLANKMMVKQAHSIYGSNSRIPIDSIYFPANC